MSTATQKRTSVQEVQAATVEERLLDDVLERTVEKLDAVASKYAKALGEAELGHLRRAMLVASAIERLDAAIDDKVMAKFMRLMNTKLGFKTDRPSKSNPSPYTAAEVKRCVIAGLLRGFFPVNNEMNIIAGDFYPAQAGWERKLREVPGLTDLKESRGTPYAHNGYTGVRYGVSWKLHGQPDKIQDAEGKPAPFFAVVVQQGATPDNIIGKARAKALRAAYLQATGTTLSDPEDVDELITPAATEKVLQQAASRADALADKVGAPKPEPTIDPAQQSKLTDALREQGLDLDAFLDHFGVKALAQLPAGRYAEAVTWLEGAGAEANT